MSNRHSNRDHDLKISITSCQKKAKIKKLSGFLSRCYTEQPEKTEKYLVLNEIQGLFN